MEKYRTVLNLVLKQHATLGYGFLALLTAGGEQLFSVVVFSCPCNSWNFAYSMVFLFVPALVLFLLGYFISNRTWKLCTGCCIIQAKQYSKRILCRGLKIFVQITTGALVAPITWISVALLNGTFYECGMSGYYNEHFLKTICNNKSNDCQSNLFKLPCGRTALPLSTQEDILITLRAHSQVIGWSLIATITVFTLASTCIIRCCSPVSFLQLQFWKTYKEKENELFEQKSAVHAKQLAERNLNSFFESEGPKEIKTPSRASWEEISLLYSFSRNEEYYSTIHKYAERKADNTHASSSTINMDVPAVLDFVDGGKKSVDTHI
ncbi:calcium homeostasis modulator protein 6-like [Carcharodon carcharias]|uniref:calcium homeostasis modulator protein 6-like n=1 Tax=Carcharodon carcharias TaxID=13397 RepID=UPI001B7DB269|nr:calcium homeostasis modulator protein 6-like [Carcharodon carcharias]